MAWLEQKPSGTFHLVFRIGEQKFRRSLKTKDKKEASSRRNRVEENLRLVEAGRLDIPESVDVPTSNKTVKGPKKSPRHFVFRNRDGRTLVTTPSVP